MDIQQIAALGIVALTAALMGGRWLHRRRHGARQGGVCAGCAGAGAGPVGNPRVVVRAPRRMEGGMRRHLKAARK